MSNTRQRAPELRSFGIRLDRGAQVPDHAFGWGQLVYACSGLGRVVTEQSQWLLPPQRALWVPPGTRHVLHCSTALDLRTIYFPPNRPPALPGECTVVVVPPLLRELLLRAVSLDAGELSAPAGRRLVAVLRDEVGAAPREPLDLPLPSDPRALTLAERVLAGPRLDAPLDSYCRGVGASRRTLERRFREETGTSLGAWFRLARLHRSLVRLGLGEPVAQVAQAVGYASPSAFVAAFGAHFGCTPARYFS